MKFNNRKHFAVRHDYIVLYNSNCIEIKCNDNHYLTLYLDVRDTENHIIFDIDTMQSEQHNYIFIDDSTIDCLLLDFCAHSAFDYDTLLSIENYANSHTAQETMTQCRAMLF